MPNLPLTERSALAGVALPGHFGKVGGSPGVVIAERVGLGIATVAARRGRAAELSATVWEARGVALPDRSLVAPGRTASFIGSGPHQWLAISEQLRNGDLALDLAEQLKGLASISDQSDGRAVVRLTGRNARDILAKGLPIDLHPRVFAPGSAATSIIGHMGAQIWLVDDAPTYDIAVFRSLAESFWKWLTDSAAEFGYAVEAGRD